MLSSPTPEAASLATTCIEKLSSFMSDSDQNLRYIALKGLSALLGTGHSHLLAAHYDEILACIEEEDLTIRLKALELVERLTERATCKEVVTRLLHQVAPSTIAADGRRTTEPPSRSTGGGRSAASALRAVSSKYDKSSVSGLAPASADPSTSAASNAAALASYRYRLLLLILRLTSRSSEDGSQLYVNVSNFEWYIDTLVTVAYLSLSVHPPPEAGTDSSQELGDKIAECLLDVTARAPAVRETTVKRMQRILADDGFGDRASSSTLVKQQDTAQPVLAAAAFIVSEYGSSDLAVPELVSTLLQRAEAESQNSQLVLGAMKALARWLHHTAENWEEAQMSTVTTSLEQIAAKLGNIRSIEAAQYAQLLSVVQDGLGGPRLPKQRQAETPAAAQAEEANANDPDYNPFSTSRPSTVSQAAQTDTADVEGAPVVLPLLYGLFFSYELKPLAPGAQALVSPPDGLDLNAWIGEPLTDASTGLSTFLYGDHASATAQAGEVDEYGRPKARPIPGIAYPEEKAERKSKKKSKRREAAAAADEEDVDSIPIVKLDLGEGSSSSPSSSAAGGASSGSKRKSKATTSLSASSASVARPRSPSPPPLILSAGGDMPTQAKRSTVSITAGSSTRTAEVVQEPNGHDGQGNGSVGDIVPEQAAVKVVKAKKKKTAAVLAGEDGEVKVKKKKKKDKAEEGGS